MIFATHLATAEQESWSLDRDVAWADVRPDLALSQPDLLERLRDAAIVESYHPVHVPDVLRAVWDDLDATAVLSIELFEGLRHFEGLRRYLEQVGFEPNLTERELRDARVGVRERPAGERDGTSLLVDFMGSEHFAGYFFGRLGVQAAEPVLRQLLRRFARDEFRHAEALEDVLRQRVRCGRDAATSIVQAALAFRHYGNDVVETVPSSGAVDLAAITAFDRRIERLCGVSPRAWLRGGGEDFAAGESASSIERQTTRDKWT